MEAGMRTTAGWVMGAMASWVAGCDSEVAPPPELRVEVPEILFEDFCARATLVGRGESASTCDATAELALPCSEPATVALVLTPRPGVEPLYANPCPSEAPCLRDVACSADQGSDVGFEVTYGFTIMRDASQGFIDLVLAVTEAPLGRYCVGLSLVDPTGALVTSKTGLCSDLYGSGDGSLRYVLPCDASVDGDSILTITLESAVDAAGATRDDLRLPCGDGTRCDVAVRCEENTDTAVRVAR